MQKLQGHTHKNVLKNGMLNLKNFKQPGGSPALFFGGGGGGQDLELLTFVFFKCSQL